MCASTAADGSSTGAEQAIDAPLHSSFVVP